MLFQARDRVGCRRTCFHCSKSLPAGSARPIIQEQKLKMKLLTDHHQPSQLEDYQQTNKQTTLPGPLSQRYLAAATVMPYRRVSKRKMIIKMSDIPHHLVSPAQPRHAVTHSEREVKKQNRKKITLQTNSMVSHPFIRQHPPRSVCHTKGANQRPPLTVTARSPLSVGRVTRERKGVQKG